MANMILLISRSYSPSPLPLLSGLTKIPSPPLSTQRRSYSYSYTSLFSCRVNGIISNRIGRFSPIRAYNAGDESKGDGLDEKGSKLDWPILKRWDVPWTWQTVSLTNLACGLSFILTGLVETVGASYFGIQLEELSLDEKAEVLFLYQGFTTAVTLGVLFGITKSFPLSEDIFRYDLREPFHPQRGWLLWAGGGLAVAIAGMWLLTAITTLTNSELPKRETDALVQVLPLIGSSTVSTACLVGVTGFFAPILEETVFRGFFMVSMTKWVPTPVAILISSAVFALAHLTPGEFPQLFILGTALGVIYAQTRNLLCPIALHACWNSGVILLLTFLQLQGYDIREMVQGV